MFFSATLAKDGVSEEGVLDVEGLKEAFKALDKQTIGLVGYPNVGKSSTINALMGEKKVAVASTPGKTKHFQVL